MRPLAFVLLLYTSVCAMHGQASIVADHLPGADVGARINAADAQLGTRCGTIAVTMPGIALSPVTLSTCHSLTLDAPVTWKTNITLRSGSSGQTITCPQLQTLALPGEDWVHGESVSRVTVDSCLATGPAAGGIPFLAGFLASRTLRITRNTISNAMLLRTGSSAPASLCDDHSQCQYPGVTAANSTSGVLVQGNTARNPGVSGTAVGLGYVNDASVIENTLSGFTFGVQWWGGDACVAQCSVGQNGAFANARKTTHLTIAKNTIDAAASCIWGSMGQFLTISANTCTGNDQGDVGIDAEGSFDVTFDHNTVANYPNGDLATFTFSTRIVFDHNTATQDQAGHLLVRLDNSTQSPDHLQVAFTNNTFTCLDPAKTCTTLGAALESITFSANHFRNTALRLTANNENTVVIDGNDFTFTHPAPAAIAVSGFHHTPGVQRDGNVEISRNTIVASAPQPAGARGIFVSGDDFNFPQQTLIVSNHLSGAFPIDIECDSATTNSANQANTCTITGNQLAARAIVTQSRIPGAVHLIQSGNEPLSDAPRAH